MATSIDIWSKAAVLREVLERHKRGKVRDCRSLAIVKGYKDAFYARSVQDFAERERAHGIHTDVTGYRAPSAYYWPICPIDCPLYEQDSVFKESLARGRTVPATDLSVPSYVDLARIGELLQLPKGPWDLTKLIRLCTELNLCTASGATLAIPLLLRALVDHVPPIFRKGSFTEVANNYGDGGKSFKDAMKRLDSSLRSIADSYLHVQVRSKEVLPTRIQVNFAQELDVLLQEIVRVLR